MKKIFWTILCVFICVQLTGCAGWGVHTSTSRKPRVDQEISGNRGFIAGKPTSAPKEPTFTERKIYRIELEIPQWPRKSRKRKLAPIPVPKKDKVLWGNKGYIFGGPKEKVFEEEPVIVKSQVEKPTQIRTYKARKGDTLQKISRRFYGTTKKWPLLYKANRDKLKRPDKVYPGQVLIIPEVSQYKK